MGAQQIDQPPFDVVFELEGRRVVYLDCRNALMCSKETFAAMMGVSVDTVVAWMHSGTLPSVKMGRPRFVNLSVLRSDLASGKTVFAQGDYSDE